MARAPSNSDVFTAVAEPQRRRILSLLRGGERPVGQLSEELGIAQPSTSKHLGVLRDVGLVAERASGKQRLYRLDVEGLRPLREWVGSFEDFWAQSFDRLDEYVQKLDQQSQEGIE